MTTKAELHQLIDALPEPALTVAARLLAQLEAQEAALPAFLRNAPLVEPEEDELEALAEAAADPASGKSLSQEELEREFGLR